MSKPDTQQQGIEPPLRQWWEQYKRRRSRADEHRVRVFVRSFAPAPGQHDRRGRLIGGLQSATDSALIDEFDVRILGEEICCCEQCQQLTAEGSLPDTVESLKGWRDGSVRSCGFTERTVNSSVTGDHHRLIVPPELAFGIYTDGSLSGVFPCQVGTETYLPDSYLERLLETLGQVEWGTDTTRVSQ